MTIPLDLAGAGAIAPRNGALHAVALSAADREELILGMTESRPLQVGDDLQAIGPLPNKHFPAGAARTQILASVGEGWRVAKFPGAVGMCGKDAYITKKAALSMWKIVNPVTL